MICLQWYWMVMLILGAWPTISLVAYLVGRHIPVAKVEPENPLIPDGEDGDDLKATSC
jgi:hypothetical protein